MTANYYQAILPALCLPDETQDHFDHLKKSTQRQFAITAMEYLSTKLCVFTDDVVIRNELTTTYSLVKLLCEVLQRFRSANSDRARNTAIADDSIINPLLQLLSNCIYHCPTAQVRLMLLHMS
jgi:hypothetical protein